LLPQAKASRAIGVKTAFEVECVSGAERSVTSENERGNRVELSTTQQARCR
jgi:hypothetical protein